MKLLENQKQHNNDEGGELLMTYDYLIKHTLIEKESLSCKSLIWISNSTIMVV